jgi:hypothetical protein
MKLIRIFALLGLLGAAATLTSCKKDAVTISQVSFVNTSATYSESQGSINVAVSLSAPQSQDVTVNYSWSSSDSTYLGADFSFPTSGMSLTIPKGQTSGNIQIQIIDDTQIDGPDDVFLTITGTSTNAAISGGANAQTFDLTITDNDVAPANAMQFDLAWGLTTRYADINGANLDFDVLDSVQVDPGTGDITYAHYYQRSDHTTGFETLVLTSSDLDVDYYLYYNYTSGTGGPVYLYITYTPGSGFTNDTGYIGFEGGLPEMGYYNYDGPHTKSGSSISRVIKSESRNGRNYFRISAKDFHHK